MPLLDVIRRYKRERSLAEWAGFHNWSVTTLEDCEGYPPAEPTRGWALYDAHEDDGAIGVFSLREDAERIAEILNDYGRRG